MTTITYIFGNTVDERQKLLSERLSSTEDGRVLHLVSTRGRVIELETDSMFWLRKRTDTLTGLINRIFEEDVRPHHYAESTHIDQSLRCMLVRRVLENRAKTPEGLGYFHSLLKESGNREYPAVYRSIAAFFSQLVKNNREDRFANDLAGRMEESGHKGYGLCNEQFSMESDLLWLFGDYEELKLELNCFDDDDIQREVRDYLREGGSPAFFDSMDALIMDGFDFFTPIEEDILFQLMRLADNIYWLIDFKYRGEKSISDFRALALQSSLDQNCDCNQTENKGLRGCFSIAGFLKRIEESGIDQRVEGETDLSSCNSSPEPHEYSPEPDENYLSRLKIRSFSSEIEEVRAIASEIKRLLHEGNANGDIDPGAIRVIFPELNDYSAIVTEIFNEYGLPFSITSGLPLSSHPFSDLFLKILDLPINRFERDDIFSLFSSNIIQLTKIKTSANAILDSFESDGLMLSGDDSESVKRIFDEYENGIDGQQPDVHLFDRAARRCGLKRFFNESNAMEIESLASIRDYYLAGIKKSRSSREKRNLRFEYYGFLLQYGFFRELLSPFMDLTRQKEPSELLNVYTHILNNLGFPANLTGVSLGNADRFSHEDRKIQKRDTRAYSLLRDLADAGGRALMLVKKVFGIHEGYELLSSFRDLFQERLKNSYLLDERNPGLVRVSQWFEVRGRSFDYIFAGGMTADKFPLTESPDFILNNISERAFRSPNPADQSQYLLSHILKNTRETLYLSCPEYRNEKEVQPSRIIMDIRDMIETGESGDAKQAAPDWRGNPYLTSPLDLLNAGLDKVHERVKNNEGIYRLKNIVLKNREREEDVIRGIRAMASREAVDGLFEYDGILEGSSKFSSFLKKQDNVFSASRLDMLANCPMRYLFSTLFELTGMDEAGPEASAPVMGNFVHEILGVFFEKLSRRSTNVRETGLNKAFSMASQLINDYFSDNPFINRFEFSEFFRNRFAEGLDRAPELKGMDSPEREGIFPMLLRYEEKMMGDRIPECMEYGFGHDGVQGISLGRIMMRGFIDRFDRDRNDSGRLFLYDYKTGRSSSAPNIKKGLSFQLPVYIKAVKFNGDASRISASFYSLRRDSLSEDPMVLTISEECGGEGLDISGVRLFDEYGDQLFGMLHNGRFHHSADGLDCDFCEFRYACHRDPVRMKQLIKSETGEKIYSGDKNLEKWERAEQFRKEWKKVQGFMEKAFSLKTPSGRKNNYEKVLEFRQDLETRRAVLPFYEEYIEKIINEIEGFEKTFA